MLLFKERAVENAVDEEMFFLGGVSGVLFLAYIIHLVFSVSFQSYYFLSVSRAKLPHKSLNYFFKSKQLQGFPIQGSHSNFQK